MSKTIMIVEDEQILREIIKDYLLEEGYEVLEADDGKKLWRYSRNMSWI